MNQMAHQLMVEPEGGQPRSLALEHGRVTVGRSSENDLAYPDDPVMSRKHLVIERVGEEWFVEDLKSKNGTQLNGQRLAGRIRLKEGDRIAVGRLSLVFANTQRLSDHTVVFVDDGDTGTASVSTSISVKPEDVEAALAKPEAAGTSRVQALIEAGRQLSQHRPLSELFQVILDLATKSVGARRGVLTTLEHGELVVRAVRGDEFRISRAVRDQVINEKKSLMVLDTSQDDMLKASMTIVQQRVRSLMAVPLQTADRVTGLIYVDMPDIIRPFTHEDLTLLTVLANTAAIRIEHARLVEVEHAERIMAKELEQAADIQRRLLPHEPPEVPSLDIAGSSVPCRSVGGDYFDYVWLPGGRLAVMVGDVAGKGMAAALLMSSLQARVQILAEEDEPLAKLITRLNRSVASACPDNRFITFFIAVFDPATGEFEYVNAGHNPPYVVRASGEVEALTEGGPIMGILRNIIYKEARAQLNFGDVLAIFSDGITEAHTLAEDEYGEDRLQQELVKYRNEDAASMVTALHRSVLEFVGDAPAADDMTLLIVKRSDNSTGVHVVADGGVSA
jgi:serine phosphatase RsbU (regulator of sigma subunit)